MYDITDADSFQNLEYWFDELEQRLAANEIVMSVVGNKTDLSEKARSVSREDG